MKWQEVKIPIKLLNCAVNNSVFYELENTESDKMKQTLNIKYKTTNLEEIADLHIYLTLEEKK